MLDLQPFCSKDETRSYLTKPFSFGDYTFATNGHLMVRVPKRDDVPPTEKKEVEWDKPMKGWDSATYSPVELSLPPMPEDAGECDSCDGSGRAHDCPDCECECTDCDGTGHDVPEKGITTTIRGRTYQLRYVRQIAALPGLQVADTSDGANPLLFKFDGGFGALMPTRGKMLGHVDTEKQAA